MDVAVACRSLSQEFLWLAGQKKWTLPSGPGRAPAPYPQAGLRGNDDVTASKRPTGKMGSGAGGDSGGRLAMTLAQQQLA